MLWAQKQIQENKSTPKTVEYAEEQRTGANRTLHTECRLNAEENSSRLPIERDVLEFDERQPMSPWFEIYGHVGEIEGPRKLLDPLFMSTKP